MTNATQGFNDTTIQPATPSRVLSHGDRAWGAVQSAYGAFGSTPEAFGLLQKALQVYPLSNLNLSDNLKSIQEKLQDPTHSDDVRIKHPAPPRPGHAFERSVQRTAEDQDRFEAETRSGLENGRKAFQSEILSVAVGGAEGFSIHSNNAFDWIAKNIKGGQAIQDSVPAIARTLFIVSDHIERGHSLEDSVKIASHYASGQKVLSRENTL